MDRPPIVRVLLVEDDEDDLVITQELLAAAEGTEYELDWASTFDQAVERLLSRAYDVVLLDHNLGSHTGLEVLGVAAKSGIETPLILLTGQYRRDLDLQAMDEGAVDFLVKGTLSADLLERAIRYAIHRARMERELAQARDAAIAANRHKSVFLANMSHEIRTPLNGVIGMTTMMLDMPLSHQQHGIVQSIHTSAKSLMDIINDILDLSKIESGHIELEAVELDPAEILWDVRDVVIASAHAKGIELVCQAPPKAPRLQGDPGRLRQILVNLAGNAVKFTHRGHVHLRLDTEPMVDGRTHVTFRIVDTGIGIPMSDRGRLFQSFTQADSSTTRKFGGTGLGLSISQRLVKLMGGHITFDSVEGEGSTFCFSIPLRTVAPRPEPNPAPLRGRRILLIDANDTTAGTFAAYLEASGARCERTSDVHEALPLLIDRADAGMPFDTVIADQPASGAGVPTTWLDAAGPLDRRPQVFLLSRMNGESRSSDSLAVGAAVTLYKPPRPSRVVQMLCESTPTLCEPTPAPNDATPAADHGGLPTHSKRPHLLIADDNAINRRVAMAQVERLGYSADAVANGLEVLDALSARSYDLILMDCQMPEMDGYEATREIRRRFDASDRRPIVALTASARVEDREHCLSVGMDDYLSKPITLDRLGRVLERWLEAPCRGDPGSEEL